MQRALLSLLIITLMTGCEFLRDANTYKTTAKEFIEALLKEDYNTCISNMALNHESAKGINIDTLKTRLGNVRAVIIENFGTDLDYTFMKAEKTFVSSNDRDDTNTTTLLLQFSNGKEFGVLEFAFDDISKKILRINIRDIKQPVPSTAMFWLFGVVALCVTIFNVYMLIKIRKIALRKKWLKYIAVILFNVPTITFTLMSGITLNIFSLQILLGISFSFMGYLNATWSFGIPLGGLYWLWRLKRKVNLPLEDNTNSASEILDIPNQ